MSAFQYVIPAWWNITRIWDLFGRDVHVPFCSGFRTPGHGKIICNGLEYTTCGFFLQDFRELFQNYHGLMLVWRCSRTFIVLGSTLVYVAIVM